MTSAQNDNGEDTNYFDLSVADLQKLDSGKLAELIGRAEDLIKKLNANEKKKGYENFREKLGKALAGRGVSSSDAE